MHQPRRTMAYGELETPDGVVLLALHTKAAPSQGEWEGWCDMLRRRGEAVQWDLSRGPNIVVTDGGAPSTAQRTMVNSLVALGKQPPRVAVMTSSVTVRAIARAFSIFNPMFRVFSPEQLPAALSFLGLISLQRDLLLALHRLEADQLGTGAVKTLEILRRSTW